MRNGQAQMLESSERLPRRQRATLPAGNAEMLPST